MEDLLDTGNRNTRDYRPATVPNATAVLVLGICSIVGCFMWGAPGLICGIIALLMHRKDKGIYVTDPEKYEASFKNSKAGYICAMIGTILSGVVMLFWLIYIIFIVSVISSVAHY